MRVSPARRRRWNNILILGVIAFLVILNAPETMEVWYQDLDEPQRVTFYRLDNFWLFKNW